MPGNRTNRKRIQLSILFLIAVIVAFQAPIEFRSRPSPAIPVLRYKTFAFNLDPASQTDLQIPDPIAKFDGRMVTVIGDTWQPSLQGNAAEFELTDSSQFHSYMPRPPLAQEFVFVHINASVSAIPQQVRVTGILHITIEKDDTGKITSLYKLVADRAAALQPNNGPVLNTGFDHWPTVAVIATSVIGVMVVIGLLIRSRRLLIRARSSLCPHCGYDLRATTYRCPECGKRILMTRRQAREVMARFEAARTIEH